MFFVDGDPQGLLTAEVFGWTGHVIRIPRLRLKAGLDLPEAAHTGVYILLGDADDARAYIGEAESVSARIRSHDAQRDWWQTALLVTTSSDALHKAHVKFLESRMVEEAKKAGTFQLDNANIPPRSSLNPAAISNMESFLDTVRMVLPALGISIFESGRVFREKKTTDIQPDDVIFELSTPKHGVTGRARPEGSEFVVLEGSKGRSQWSGVPTGNYPELHAKLLQKGILVVRDGYAEFVEDYAFNSPTAAAVVLNGRSTNGRTAWKLPDGRSFADWEQDQLTGQS